MKEQNGVKYIYEVAFKIPSFKKGYRLIISLPFYETQEGARHCRKPLGWRNLGIEISTIIFIYIFDTFTDSNTVFHKLLRRISGTLHSSLSCYILSRAFVTKCR